MTPQFVISLIVCENLKSDSFQHEYILQCDRCHQTFGNV